MDPVLGVQKIDTWEQALYGNLGHPRFNNTAEDILWDSGAQCAISARTLWDTFRMAIIWFLWCQYVQYDLKEGNFHVGIILFKAWQTTAQIGMAAWRQLLKFKRKRNPQKHAEMERTLLLIWGQGNIFCSPQGRIPIWRPIPRHSFLPRELATKLRSTRVRVRVPGLPGYISQPSGSSSNEQSTSTQEGVSSRNLAQQTEELSYDN